MGLAETGERLVRVGIVTTAVLIVFALVDLGSLVAFWENAHWTIAIGVAVIWAWLGFREASGLDRTVRWWLLLGLLSYAVGQVLWDIEVAIGVLPVPAPSDVFFLLPAVPATVALYRAAHARLDRTEELAVYLDGATVFLAISALVLAIWGDQTADLSFAQQVVLFAYPIVYLASAGAALVWAFTLRSPPEPRGMYAILAGTALLGLAWAVWLPGALNEALVTGVPVNPLFSIGIVLVGYGAATWTSERSTNATYERAVRVLLGLLPALAILMSATILVLHHAGEGQATGGFELGPIDALTAAALILAVVRQSRLLMEREGSVRRERTAREETAAALDRLAETEARYRTLVERVPAVVYLAEADRDVSSFSRLLYVGPQAREMLGYEPDELVADPELWTQLLYEGDRRTALERELAHFMSGEPLEHEYRLVRKDGTPIWVRDEAVIIPDADGRPRLSHGFLVDIAERKRLEEELRHQAFHDSLTGLANRGLFADRVEHALTQRQGRRPRSVAVLFLDLDDFKTVNDSLGHEAGDELLVQVADRLRLTVRAGDTAARLGGDEFGILLEDVDAPMAEGTAQRILSALVPPFVIQDKEVVARASIGIATGMASLDDAASLLRDADAAMYQAKGQGKGRYAFFEPSIHVEALARLESKADLQRALERDEFIVEYQPIIDIRARTGEIAGFEALVRWMHPERGRIAPDEFIPLAEETGIIVPLGRWIMGQACREAQGWNEARPDENLSIGVNLSPRQLFHEDLLEDVEAALTESRLEPSQLILEITESIVMQDLATAVATLHGLRGLGVRIAIDDFGTGYSSLSYLSRLPVDILKVDRSFVAALDASREEAALVRAVFKIGQILRMEVVAEGVETRRQLDLLRRLGCRYAQGFLFSPAVDRERAAELVQRVDVPVL